MATKRMQITMSKLIEQLSTETKIGATPDALLILVTTTEEAQNLEAITDEREQESEAKAINHCLSPSSDR